MAETEEELQQILDVEASEEKGLTLNSKKTISMVFTREKEVPFCAIKVHNETIKQETHFTFLGEN